MWHNGAVRNPKLTLLLLNQGFTALCLAANDEECGQVLGAQRELALQWTGWPAFQVFRRFERRINRWDQRDIVSSPEAEPFVGWKSTFTEKSLSLSAAVLFPPALIYS